jgi:hypothetical protein
MKHFRKSRVPVSHGIRVHFPRPGKALLKVNIPFDFTVENTTFASGTTSFPSYHRSV